MPRPPQPSNPDKQTELTIHIPGWLKNNIIEHAANANMNLAQWVATVLYTHDREQRTLPTAPEGRALPSLIDELRAYLAGERILMPCGEVSCGFRLDDVNGVGFCGVCGVRVG